MSTVAFNNGVSTVAFNNGVRDTVNFDFAWRFSHATEPRYDQCSFEQNVNYGKGYIWQGSLDSKEECCNECANRETCRAWDWNGHTCFVKDNDDEKQVQVGKWSGRLAGRSNSTEPAQSSVTFNDTAWAVVDTPHDMGLSQQAHCMQGGRRLQTVGSFAHNCTGWYRKHYHLPAAWKGSVVWVYFEGI